MNILGFNPSHHSSACILRDGEIKYFIEDERLTRIKYGTLPFLTLGKILKKFKIDAITWSTPSIFYPKNSNIKIPINNKINPLDSIWQELIKPYATSELLIYDLSDSHHHIAHAAHAFYNSGFKKSLGVVIDGLGSGFYERNKNFVGQETETMFECSYPNNFKVIQKNLTDWKTSINLSRSYEAITEYLGWSNNEAGKTMGLAPYGNFNAKIPNIINKQKINQDLFSCNAYNFTLNLKNYPELKLKSNPKDWHYDKSKITNLEKDLAWKIQNDTQQAVGDLIEQGLQKTKLNQVSCSGGYFLNCVTNYYLTKRFPDVEFYFEPIANDAGTAIGAAKWVWHHSTQDRTIRPFKSLYLGKQYSKKKLLKGIKKYT